MKKSGPAPRPAPKRTLSKVMSRSPTSKDDAVLNRKPKLQRKFSLVQKIVLFEAKLERLTTKLETEYDGVPMDSSRAVRSLNALIQKTQRQLGALKMKQYSTRASRRGTLSTVVSRSAADSTPSSKRGPSLLAVATAEPRVTDYGLLAESAKNSADLSADSLSRPDPTPGVESPERVSTISPLRSPLSRAKPAFSRSDSVLSSRSDSVLSDGKVVKLSIKAQRKVASLDAKIEACKAKMQDLQTKLEEDYDGVRTEDSRAVKKLNDLIQKTSRQLGKLKMAQYKARQMT